MQGFELLPFFKLSFDIIQHVNVSKEMEFSTIYSLQKKLNRIAWGQSNPANISVTALSHSQKQQAILLHFWLFLE